MPDLPSVIVPTSSLAWMEQRLVELVPLSAAFQSRVGVSNQADAARWVHRTMLLPTGLDGVERPCALVEQGDFSLRRVDNNHLRPASTLQLVLTDWLPWPDEPGWSMLDFKNFVGGVLDDLALLQGQDTNLPIESMTLPLSRLGVSDPRSGSERQYLIAVIAVEMSNK